VRNLSITEKSRLLKALEKFVALDMALALSAYDGKIMVID
jgi:hypothetical protein